MFDNASFRCPVCRAEQMLRESCRRCQADLQLVLRAHRRLAYLKLAKQQAHVDGNRQLEQSLAAELQWLAPGR